MIVFALLHIVVLMLLLKLMFELVLHVVMSVGDVHAVES
jgi:hypothetical protein